MDAPPDLRITITDIRRAGYCVSGARRWSQGHAIDFRAFLTGGVLATDLPDDAFANRVVALSAERGGGK